MSTKTTNENPRPPLADAIGSGPSDHDLAEHIGSICVSGEVLTGTALVKYLNMMPTGDKESMLDDLALLRSWAMLERTVPDAPNH